LTLSKATDEESKNLGEENKTWKLDALEIGKTKA
jgi:hypothetical protein